MQLLIHARMRTAPMVVLLALGLLPVSCAMNPNSKSYTQMLSGSANPIGVQTGRLIVVAYDSSDGGPLINATVDVVSADQSVRDPNYFRKVDRSDWRGMVTFFDVPRLVNIYISHPRGSYGLDNYVVVQGQPSEFRVYVDTQGPRTREECLAPQLCGR